MKVWPPWAGTLADTPPLSTPAPFTLDQVAWLQTAFACQSARHPPTAAGTMADTPPLSAPAPFTLDQVAWLQTVFACQSARHSPTAAGTVQPGGSSGTSKSASSSAFTPASGPGEYQVSCHLGDRCEKQPARAPFPLRRTGPVKPSSASGAGPVSLPPLQAGQEYPCRSFGRSIPASGQTRQGSCLRTRLPL